MNYGSHQEIIRAVKSLALKVQEGKINPESINKKAISESLYTSNMSDPELLIRTSGEHRLSNFLLWQIAYTEILSLIHISEPTRPY